MSEYSNDSNRDRRRERLRHRFDQSRRPSKYRHQPPEDPEDFEEKPWWRYSLEIAMDNPLILLFLGVAIVALWYWLFH